MGNGSPLQTINLRRRRNVRGITECVVVLGAGENCVKTMMHQHLNWLSRLLGHPGTGQVNSWIREKREYLSKVRLRVLYIRSKIWLNLK